MRGEALRFLVAGAANTAAGYVVYLLLLAVVSYPVAYTLSYGMGIVLSYALNTFFVFRRPWSWARLAAFPLVYLSQYLIGIACLALLVERFDVSRKLAPLAVIVATLPVTFLLSRFIVKGRSQ